MTTAPDRSPALQAAVDALGAALEALGPFERMPLATQTLNAGGYGSKEPAEAKAVWLAIHTLTNGATAERLDHLVSVLEVCGPTTRQALVITARTAVAGDKPRSAFWLALQTLADTIVE